ncbi:MAG: regulatory iron-sulfur-containing complex subunit RicT [Pseudomonadota bacterium]
MENQIKLVPLRFREHMRAVQVEAGPFEAAKGDIVMVATDHGLEPATIAGRATIISFVKNENHSRSIMRIERPATSEEIAQQKGNLIREKEALHYCIERIREINLPMKLVSTESFFDGSKILFYFTSEGRVDFRELVKTLVHKFHTRIEMRQIGVRNETKLLGGVSHCGRELCCTSFLSEFGPISIRMAKEQDLPLNPAKISGMCGRLLCCLAYEYKIYCEMKRGLPKIGKKIQIQEGECKVIRHNCLRSTFIVVLPDGKEMEISPEDIKTEPAAENGP